MFVSLISYLASSAVFFYQEDHLQPGEGWDIAIELAPCATPEETSLPTPTLPLALTNEEPSSELLYNKIANTEKLSEFEQKVEQMTAENNQIVTSIQKGQLIREDLTSVAEQWSFFLRLKDRELKDANRDFHGLRLIKETSKAQLYREVLMKSEASRLDQVASEQVLRLQEELKETRNESESLQVMLRTIEDSLKKGKTSLNQLKESNSRTAEEVEAVRLNIESLRQAQELLDNELNDVRSKRMKMKCHNESLKKEKSRLSAQQTKIALETVALRTEYESLGNELRAIMGANQSLRRAARRSEVRTTEMTFPSLILGCIRLTLFTKWKNSRPFSFWKIQNKTRSPVLEKLPRVISFFWMFPTFLLPGMGIPSQSNRLSNFSKNLFTGREPNARTLDKLTPENVFKGSN